MSVGTVNRKVIAILCSPRVSRVVCGVATGMSMGVILLVLWSMAALGAPPPGAPPGKSQDGPSDREFGLFFREIDGGTALTPALTQASDMTVDISGIILRGTVVQKFRNDSGNWMEGIYLFPLPDDASVDGMTLLIGDRRIEGEIQEKEQAKRTYARAIAEGKKASLLSQNRPNIFTTKIANIAPGEEISVEIRFQSLVKRTGLEFSATLPMVVLPRFFPKPDAEHMAGTIADMRALTQRITGPGTGIPGAKPVNPTKMTVNLDAGTDLAQLESPSHQLNSLHLSEGQYRISLKNGAMPADRDFVLRWQMRLGQAPKTLLFDETIGQDHYLLTMVMPPSPDHDPATPMPRDITFIIDTSGSMHGTSIDQARKSLDRAVSHLNPQDRFDIIRFSSDMERLFGETRPADEENLRNARLFIKRLAAGGGTNMYPALASALGDKPQENSLRQILFLTDGAVGNETQLFSLVADKLGDARLFTVGLGPAPNGWFMRKAAEFGRGSYSMITNPAEAETRMDALFDRMGSPALTDVGFDAENAFAVENFPPQIPDLYTGEPVIFTTRIERAGGEIEISGRHQDQEWLKRLDRKDAKPSTGVAKLWARHKVEALMDLKTLGMDEETVRLAVLDVALTHGILSRYTSFVAVDKTPVRPQLSNLETEKLAANAPKGLDMFKQQQRLAGPATATPMTLNLIAGFSAILSALILFLLLGRRQAR